MSFDLREILKAVDCSASTILFALAEPSVATGCDPEDMDIRDVAIRRIILETAQRVKTLEDEMGKDEICAVLSGLDDDPLDGPIVMRDGPGRPM